MLEEEETRTIYNDLFVLPPSRGRSGDLVACWQFCFFEQTSSESPDQAVHPRFSEYLDF